MTNALIVSIYGQLVALTLELDKAITEKLDSRGFLQPMHRQVPQHRQEQARRRAQDRSQARVAEAGRCGSQAQQV
jgi:hypothetical protein